MRDFNEADKKKKQRRIKIEENPGNLSPEQLSQLEKLVRESLKNGYLPCPTAWRIAKEMNIPRVAVGNITDRLGVRVTDCQVGCFKVDKDFHEELHPKKLDDTLLAALEILDQNRELTCAGVMELAVKNKLAPLDIADVANSRHWKIRQCQLGCF